MTVIPNTYQFIEAQVAQDWIILKFINVTTNTAKAIQVPFGASWEEIKEQFEATP